MSNGKMMKYADLPLCYSMTEDSINKFNDEMNAETVTTGMNCIKIGLLPER